MLPGMSDDPPPPKVGRNRQIALAPVSHSRPPGYLPPEVGLQCPIAQRAFTLLLAKPGRSLSSIARELGTSPSTLSRLSRAGHWAAHLQNLLANSPESLVIAAKQEAQRSRAEMLASNPMRQATLDAAIKALIVVDEHGNATLRPGVEMREVAALQQAAANHVKTTMLLTGEEAAIKRAAAAASAPKIVINTRDMVPEPVPVAGSVVSHPVSVEV